ncbi:LytR/AlgR family response regulator transcription factor [Polaribacter butkevichii]|uniref:DNA-binding response regulator n=1 Tax=Polaribacter butkevichii TaxID=218490 RepID=A0A2P6CA64_9FLAO|nr:LytTR family DNA-binding domain-containing protein [Polaribacter butkevichii]PQJ71789.1 DNA-binding response regulator [Polaribacter butkevichii]
MKTIKTILIDDERKALAILKNKIERLCPNLEIVAETQSPKEAIKLIKNLQPQLIFLDISMPEINGFDLLKEFDNPNFEIIFATAFDNYAIEAIKHCAIGYLVKPIDNSDLVSAVKNAAKNIEEKTALQKNKLLIENLGVQTFQMKKMVIPSTEGLEFVKIADIIHCEGIDGYTKIHFSNHKPILSSQSIGHFNKLLINQNFYLVHKSHLINLQHIEKYLNEGYVLLSANHKVPVSRNRRQEFLNNLKA